MPDGVFLAFEALIASAHNRRLSLLRELDSNATAAPFKAERASGGQEVHLRL
jgi:hypothetical protein